MWNALRLPSRFPNSLAETEFLQAFRESGLRSAKIAFVIAAIMALAFWLVLAVAPTATQVSLWRQSARLLLFVVLGTTAVYLHLQRREAIKAFRSRVGVPMGIACLVVGSMGLLPLDSGGLAVNRFVVAMSLTCWLCYGFTRLPTAIVAASCGPASLLTLIGSSLQGDDHVLALGIYLGVANLIGWIMSVEIERRERALFWSSRQLAEAKRALEEMARNAAEASAARTRVLAAVSHDLRQPLASLSLYAGLLRTRNDALEPAGLAGTVERLDACVSALSGNLDRLSELGGLRALESPLPVERIDLRRLLGRIDSVYSAEASRRGVRLVVRVPRPGRQFAVSNDNRLWDVLSNLVGNAMKFSATERAPWVLIRVRRAGAKLVIEVRDNGIGIAPADQRRVFDEYFQVANHARNPEHGYGMGLSIVRETVSRLPDHAIGLVSQPGRGTRVAVTLPAADALASTEALTNPVVAAAQTSWPSAADVRRVEGAAQRSEGARHCESPQAVYRVGSGADTESIQANAVRTDEGCAAPIEPLQGAYVLFIEDDASMRDALGRMLEHWGALVETAASGEEALQISVDAERSFDAIVSDFRLPGAWDGLRLIEELRTREGLRTPAIVLSGEFSVEKLRRGAPDDVRVMAKPPDLAVLREFLEASARGAHQLRA